MQTSQKHTQFLFGLLLFFGMIIAAAAQPSFPAPGVSDQQAGWMLAYPYYTSNATNSLEDTAITISNASASTSALVHVLFLDGRSCFQADLFICLTPNASQMFKASEIDPDNTGYIIAYAVEMTGPNAGCAAIASNILIGNAFVNIPSRSIQGNYGAEAFNSTTRGGTSCVLDPSGTFATISFPAPNRFAVEIQSPVDIPNQTIVVAGLSGNASLGLTGAGQVGVGQLYNGNERPFGSFGNWLPAGCQSTATITNSSPRVPLPLSTLIPSGQVGTLRFDVTAGVGLLLTPINRRGRSGIRSLHKIGVTTSQLIVPVFGFTC